MNRSVTIFIVRAVVGLVFAVLLTRFFHPEMTGVATVGLAVIMVGLAYLFDYLRKRKTGE